MHENPTWSTAYKNQLPDSAFLYVDKRACEHTDREGRSHPLSCRHFPYRNHLGTVSLSHVRNAISRAPQSNLPSSVQREVQQKARRLLDREGRMAANRKGSSMSNNPRQWPTESGPGTTPGDAFAAGAYEYRLTGGDIDVALSTYSNLASVRRQNYPYYVLGYFSSLNVVQVPPKYREEVRRLRADPRYRRYSVVWEHGHEISEMRRRLEAAGYDPDSAVDLAAEGIGTEELRERLRVPPGQMGSLSYSHGVPEKGREGSSRRRGINATMGGSVKRNPTVSTTQTGHGVLTGRKAHEGLVPYGPGKFDTTLDEAVYASINDIMDADVGNSSYDTWAAVAKNGPSIADYIGANYESDIGNASLDFLRTKGAAGVIVFVNSDGFVQVVYYDNAQELEKDWAETEEKLSGGGDFQENPTRGARGEQASRAKFENLRRRYIGARAALTDAQLDLGWRYGHARGWESYLKAAEKRKLERLRAATDRESGKFFDYLESISPRDWSYGVPSHWVIEQLSYDDAVRPVDEPLSVVPPLSHGATVPRQ